MPLTKERRGFAAMSEAKQREISSKGGKDAHIKGTAHEFNPEEARRAGRLGGEAVSQNREHMAQIGSRGGQIRGQNALNRLRTDDNGHEAMPAIQSTAPEREDAHVLAAQHAPAAFAGAGAGGGHQVSDL